MELIKDISFLKRKTEKWDFSANELDPFVFTKELAQFMIDRNAVGLAAPQCGYPYSVFVVGDPKNPDSVMAFFNPKIVDVSDEMVYHEEGCLSFPYLTMRIKRHKTIRMRYQDANGETHTHKFSGFTAMVIQHEYDHLNGVTFDRKATKYHRDQGKRRKNKLERGLVNG